jgi:hypothetical protein
MYGNKVYLVDGGLPLVVDGKIADSCRHWRMQGPGAGQPLGLRGRRLVSVLARPHAANGYVG